MCMFSEEEEDQSEERKYRRLWMVRLPQQKDKLIERDGRNFAAGKKGKAGRKTEREEETAKKKERSEKNKRLAL